jgi:mono/diheme cytochrome c family protein
VNPLLTSPFRSIRPPILALALPLLLAGCHRDMYEQAYKRPLDPDPFFPNHASARPLEPGTVPREDPADLGPAETGLDHGQLVLDLPVAITPALLNRGREQFGIYCAICHGADGYGHGMIVQRGFPAPPSLHSDRLRQAPAGHFFDVMTRGYGVMYPYASRVTPADRWAITAYIRALQLSQNAPAAALPANLQPPPIPPNRGGTP